MSIHGTKIKQKHTIDCLINNQDFHFQKSVLMTWWGNLILTLGFSYIDRV